MVLFPFPPWRHEYECPDVVSKSNHRGKWKGMFRYPKQFMPPPKELEENRRNRNPWNEMHFKVKWHNSLTKLCSYIRIQEYVKKMGKLENGGFVIPYIFISKIFNPGLEANETDFMMCDSIGWFTDEPAILRDSYDTFPWTVAFGGTSFWVVALDSLRLKQLWGGVLCKNYLGGNFGGAIAYILQDQRLFKQLW